MYIVVVLTLMLIFPLAGIGIEHHSSPTLPLMLLIGK
jgi:hypothetical protein